MKRSTYIRNKILNLLKELHTHPIRVNFLDLDTSKKISYSEILIPTFIESTNKYNETLITLEFTVTLFKHSFITPILYKPGFMTEFVIELRERGYKNTIPHTANQILLEILLEIKRGKKQINVFIQGCFYQRKRDNIKYIKMFFYILNFVLSKKIIQPWVLDGHITLFHPKDVDLFVQNIDFRNKKQVVKF